jgi:hypothetical protein
VGERERREILKGERERGRGVRETHVDANEDSTCDKVRTVFLNETPMGKAAQWMDCEVR